MSLLKLAGTKSLRARAAHAAAALAATAFLLAASTASAVIYYVATSGLDTNTGLSALTP